MQLGKVGYYADFIVYPALLLPLGTPLVLGSSWQQKAVWLLACVIGFAGSTLLEYVIHRLVLHHVPPFRRMHQMHHDNPTALIGTPTWLSLTFLVGGVLLPALWCVGWVFSSGLTFGLVAGYLVYLLIHHAIHRWRTHEGTFLYRAKRRHGQHHYARVGCNYGVTTDGWDRLFGSTQSPWFRLTSGIPTRDLVIDIAGNGAHSGPES